MSFFSQHRLRFVQFNTENLFVRLDAYRGQDLNAVTEREWKSYSISTVPNKRLAQTREIARAVLDLDPDVLMLCEVGGIESLENFSRHFLGNAYRALLIEGNSDRGIDLGYLVKRSLPWSYDLRSHKQRPIDFLYPHERLSIETGYAHLRSARKDSHRFSRDVLELRIFEADDEAASAAPICICLLVHLKSQLDRSRIDPGGRDRRQAELEKLVEIYREIDSEFEGRVPVLLGGDFNGKAARPEPDLEFAALYRDTQLRDALELANVLPDERFTHQQLHNTRVGVHKQLDYIFVSPPLQPRVNTAQTWVYRYIDEHGTTKLIPRTLNEKRMLPSDHFPVVLTLNPAAD